MMENKFILVCILFSCLLTTFSCKKRNLSDGCQGVEATVKDFRSLAGCKFLLETKDGKTYNPAGYTGTTEGGLSNLANARQIRFEFEKMEDAMSNCMRGEMVTITCMEILEEGRPSSGMEEGNSSGDL